MPLGLAQDFYLGYRAVSESPPLAAPLPLRRKIRGHSQLTSHLPLPGKRGPGCLEADPEALHWPKCCESLLPFLTSVMHLSPRALSSFSPHLGHFLGSMPASPTHPCSPVDWVCLMAGCSPTVERGTCSSSFSNPLFFYSPSEPT